MRFALLAAVLAATIASVARAAGPEVRALSDEFDSPASVAAWSVSQGDLQGRGPTAYSVVDGALTIDVGRSWWVDGVHAFYASKRVTGDFVATIRIRVSGRTSDAPTANWSLAGLLVRNPSGTRANENWIGWTVGRVAGASVFERKTTRRSVSQLVLVPAPAGWLDLRVARVGPAFFLLRRTPGAKWVRQWTYSRFDLARQLEVGIDAQSGFDSDDADLVARVDYARFAPTGIPPKLRARFLEGKASTLKVEPYLKR